ncbi:glycosyltransferase family protein [Acidobacteriota bacterium]
MIRLVFYSHDTFGLGHIRRVTKLANAVVRSIPDSRCIIVTGSEKMESLTLAPGIDYVKMPGVRKVGPEQYQARCLKLPIEKVIALRTRLISAVLDRFKPHFFLVDNVPLGMGGEVKPVLAMLHKKHPHVRCILTMRDVLDSPEVIRDVWARRGDFQALKEFYDRILIFGKQEVYDPVKAYGFPHQAAVKTRFCGYIGTAATNGSAAADLPEYMSNGHDIVSVTVGGGEDGYPLVDCYLNGLVASRLSNNLEHVVFVGPYMPDLKKQAIVRRFGNSPNVHLLDFLPDISPWLEASDLVVSMGGYNSVYELLSLNLSGLIVPRVYPRKEQQIRAQRLEELGLVQMLDPGELTPDRLARKVLASLNGSLSKQSKNGLDFEGPHRAVDFIQELAPVHARE